VARKSGGKDLASQPPLRHQLIVKIMAKITKNILK